MKTDFDKWVDDDDSDVEVGEAGPGGDNFEDVSISPLQHTLHKNN